MLAQLCTTTPKLPKLCLEDDAYFFDRDFWVFRLLLAFLRDNTLPDDVDALRELYCEASYYRVGLLRHAIEAKMIGEDAMAVGVLASRTTPPPTDGAKPAKPLLPLAKLASSPPKTEKETKSSEPKPTALDAKYSELPDPFGFTSKKKSQA